MKKITLALIILSTFTFAQQKYPEYNDLWEKVSSLEAKSLPKSALKVVEKIHQKALKEKNTPQIVKSLIYKSKYALIVEEEATLTIVNQFNDLIKQSEFPIKNILENVLANMYWQYFQQHRWKFYQRTKTIEKVDKADFRTWDLTTLFNEIHLHFQNSLQNAEKLQQFQLKDIDELLVLQEGSKKYRPTLFDFLSHNALNFYKTSENTIAQPADKFEIDNPKYVSNYNDFITLKISEDAQFSLQKQALLIYQALLRFHSSKNNENALISADIERLKFVKNNAVFNEKNALFLKALQNEKKQFSNKKNSSLIDFEIALFLNNQADKYAATKHSDYRFKRAEAYTICKNVIEKFPNSFGAKKCKILIDNILQKSLEITSKTYIPIQKHSNLLVSYKNINRLYFHVYGISEKKKSNFISCIKSLKKQLLLKN